MLLFDGNWDIGRGGDSDSVGETETLIVSDLHITFGFDCEIKWDQMG